MKMKALEITIDANTSNLSAKLKAIAKHAEALANELREIDAGSCPECKEMMDITKFMHGDEVINIKYSCTSCGYQAMNK